MRVGVAGLIHGHVWGLIDAFAKSDGAELVAVADATPLLDKAKDRFQASYADWREMLDKERLDALIVTSDNRESAEIAIGALSRKIPCLVEKPMAADAADADRMIEAMESTDTTLMINWPLHWQGWPHRLKEEMKTLGKVFHLRFRIGHHGPREIGCDEYFVGWLYDQERNGGGAIADFCGYGAALCQWYFGAPESVYAVLGNFTKDYEVPDDHALCLLKYPWGTAQIEGTWATFGFDDSANPVVHGSEGTLGVYGEQIRRFQPRKDPVCIEAEKPSAGPAETFLACIREDRLPDGILNPYTARDAARIIDAAKRSAASGCAEATK